MGRIGSKMEEVLKASNAVKPYAYQDGVPVYEPADYKAVSELSAMENRLGGRGRRIIKMNPNGTPAKAFKKFLVMSKSRFFENRFSVSENKKMLRVVIDHRAIAEQADGRIYANSIPCYEFKRDSNNKLKLVKTTTVNAKDFVENYKESLNEKAMSEILELIKNSGGQEPQSLPI